MGFHDMYGNVWEWVQNTPSLQDPFWKTGWPGSENRIKMGGSSTSTMHLSKRDAAVLQRADEIMERKTPVRLRFAEILKNYGTAAEDTGVGFRIVLVLGPRENSSNLRE